jgi:hypothetical protein
MPRKKVEYWVDPKGGSHFHLEKCKMIGPPYHYEAISRTEIKDSRGLSLKRFRHKNQFFIPCVCIYKPFETRSGRNLRVTND